MSGNRYASPSQPQKRSSGPAPGPVGAGRKIARGCGRLLVLALQLGIIAVLLVLEFINLPSTFLERIIELALQAAAFIGLSMYFFKLTLRDAATLTLSFVMAAIGIVAVSGLVRIVS